MFRILLLAFALFAPVASAGISTSTDTFADPTYGCSDSSSTYDQSGGYNTNGSYQSWGYRYTSDTESCAASQDTFRGNVTSNDNDAAGARIGDDSNRSWRGETRDSYSYGSTYFGNHSYSSGYNSQYRANSYEESQARVIEASTFAGGAQAVDGCSWADSNSHDSQQSGSNFYDGNRSSSYWSSSSGHSYSSTSGCEKTLALESGITTLRAGEESGCTTQGYGSSRSSSYDTNGTSRYDQTQYQSWQSGCDSQRFAELGSERLGAGNRDGCSSYQYEDRQTIDGEERNQTYRGDQCRSEFGVFGSHGLTLALRNDSYSWESCSNADPCGGSYSGQSVVIEHEVIDSISIGVPTPPTLPSLP